MYIRTRIAAGLAVLAALTTVVVGCSAGAEPTETSTSSEPKTLTLAVSSDNLWGFVRSELGTQAHQSALYWMPLYDTVLKMTPDRTIEPNVATEWEYNDTSTELTLTIRDDVVFTDGTALDAEAVAENLLAFRDGGGGEASLYTSGITDIQATDATTIVITLSEPQPMLLAGLTASAGAVFAPADVANADPAAVPVGSGPYVLDEAATNVGSVYTYERNADYWNAEAYPFDELVLKPMPDIAARINALKAGEVDGAAVQPATAAEVEASGATLNMGVANWAGLHILDRNGELVPALGDERVRQAINMVFDREAIVENLYSGYGVVNNQMFPEDSAAHVDDLNADYPFDVDAAKQLMADAGYADGFDLPMPAIIGAHDAITPIIAQQLGLIGIRVTFDQFQLGDYFNEVFAKKYALIFITHPTVEAWQDIAAQVAPTALWNVFGTEDPELTALIDAARNGDDSAFPKIGEFVFEHAWFSPWATPHVIYATNDGVSVTLAPGQIEPLLTGIQPAS